MSAIPGWLTPDDAAKLFELASRTAGPILEIGTFHGKSATLMALALALADSDSDALIFSLDVDAASLHAAQRQAAAHGVAERIVFIRATAAAFARAYPHFRPALTFVDGDHRRAGVDADLHVLERIVPAGGTLLFHDFDDPLNDDPACTEINVRPAVQASWVSRECEFCGTFGASGMYVRRTDPPTRTPTPIVDLLPLGSPREQYRHRIRYPAGRLWRRLRGRLRRQV